MQRLAPCLPSKQGQHAEAFQSTPDELTHMKTHWKWIIGVVAFCLLTPMIVAVNSAETRFRAVEDGAETVSHFLSALNAHEYAAAHALMAPARQTALSAAALQKSQEQVEQRHGRCVLHATPNEYHPDEALNEIVYFYEIDDEQNKELPIMVRVVRTNDGWRVLEYHYDDSPA